MFYTLVSKYFSILDSLTARLHWILGTVPLSRQGSRMWGGTNGGKVGTGLANNKMVAESGPTFWEQCPQPLGFRNPIMNKNICRWPGIWAGGFLHLLLKCGRNPMPINGHKIPPLFYKGYFAYIRCLPSTLGKFLHSALCIGGSPGITCWFSGHYVLKKYDDLHTSGNAHFAFQKPKCMSAKFLCSLKSLRISPQWVPYAWSSPSQTCLSMYLCFYNIIIMCSKWSANKMLIQSLVWCSNSIATHYDDWSLYYNI